MRLCRPKMCEGYRDIEAIEAFTVSLDAYLGMHSGSEVSNVVVASWLLEGEARQRWLQLCGGAHLPHKTTSV